MNPLNSSHIGGDLEALLGLGDKLVFTRLPSCTLAGSFGGNHLIGIALCVHSCEKDLLSPPCSDVEHGEADASFSGLERLYCNSDAAWPA